MHQIFKSKKGKDFYRNALEYFEYDHESYDNNKLNDEPYIKEDDEIAFQVACKCEEK